jgi:hypothetical protein
MYAIGAYCFYAEYAGKITAATEMVIFETSIFTRRVLQLLADEEYRKLQAALVNRLQAGGIIRGSGGLRKVRRVGSGRGKRGGVRIIYIRMQPLVVQHPTIVHHIIPHLLGDGSVT